MGSWFSGPTIADFGEIEGDDFLNDRTSKLQEDFRDEGLNDKTESKMEEKEPEPITVPLHQEIKGNRKLLTTSGRRPQVLFHSIMKQKHHKTDHDHYNTTSSLFIKEVMSNPKLEQILKCLAIALESHIKNGEAKTDSIYLDIFDERKHPFTDDSFDETYPEVPIINHFLTYIFRVQGLPAEVAIICIAFVERLMAFTSITLKRDNWKRIVLSSLLLAAKVWEDESRFNVDFAQMFVKLSVAELNRLERYLLEQLQYNVTVKASQYAQYYFELRALSDVDNFSLSPLDKESLDKLEHRTGIQQAKMIQKSQKAHSMQNMISSVHHNNRMVLP
eukprot:TRINITY_DN1410_c0_g1_i1.p1 TRINITY_DN1410_c0_g1~~TRINITY_DN1410_c0_g1_i1.p1  ORF type:complete len:332 (-),score=77.56 TRINITY_DN1410_c0_g1_i1:121-1116(-)